MERVQEFKQTLSNDRLKVALQPIVGLGDRRVHHFEALARPTDGQSPATMVGFAEEIGMTQDFDLLVCQKAIDILAAQEFNDEIPAGLPPGTRVAHKTGWITGVSHDAALIYPPGRKPYVLVVLTKGIRERPVAQKLIADISRLVWESIALPR